MSRPDLPTSAEIAHLAGSERDYPYRELPSYGREAVEGYVLATRRLFAPTARAFDGASATEWFVRSYLALKFALAATLHANAARFAVARNLQMVRPYLSYYAMLSCCRAFLLTLPCRPWRGRESIEETHATIIRTSADKLKRLDPRASIAIARLLARARDQRNVISYRFPASGLSVFGEELVDVEIAVRAARLFAELAQLNTACLEGAVRKLAPLRFELADTGELWRTVRYETATSDLIDDEDYKRVSYWAKRYSGPTTLVALATDGLVQDFFGAWHNGSPGVFDPDDDYDLLLDLP